MTEYGKNTPAMYSAMTANVELFKSNEDATVSQFGAINLQQLVTDLPSMSKREFDKRANDHLAAAQALDAGIILQMSQELSAINTAPGSLNTLGKAVTAAKQRVDDAKQNVTQ